MRNPLPDTRSKKEPVLRSFSAWLGRLSSGPAALAALVVFLLFTALVLPGQAAQAEEASRGAASPDLSFFYSPGDLYRMAETYGPQGRAAYIRARWTFDLLWPLVYTAFLVTAISWLNRKIFPAGSRWQLTNLVPVAGALLDYLENLSASLVMARYPLSTPVVDWLAPVFTMLKWPLVGGSFLVLLAVLLLAAWVRLKGSAA